MERLGFCERLAGALAAAGCKPTPTMLAREFNIRAQEASVTVHGARKWLMGEAFPTQERVHLLARWLNVSPLWLRFGEGPCEPVLAEDDSSRIPREQIILLSDFRRLDERSQAVVRDLISSLLQHHAPCRPLSSRG